MWFLFENWRKWGTGKPIHTNLLTISHSLNSTLSSFTTFSLTLVWDNTSWLLGAHVLQVPAQLETLICESSISKWFQIAGAQGEKSNASAWMSTASPGSHASRSSEPSKWPRGRSYCIWMAHSAPSPPYVTFVRCPSSCSLNTETTQTSLSSAHSNF